MDLWMSEGTIGGYFQANVPGGLAVTMNLVDGMTVIDKFGVNPTVATGTDPEDIWEYGGLYIYDPDGTAPIQFLSSSSALDTGQTISIQGLDINGNLVNQVVTTNGQNNVILETPLWRVWRMENESAFGNDINGILYCHTDPTPTAGVPLAANVRAIINGQFNQTLMALYTIPKGKVGFLFVGELGIDYTGSVGAGTNFARCHYHSRRFGKVFKVKKSLSLITAGSSNYRDERQFPDIIPDLTDIRLTAEEVSETMGIWATFQILLVDEALLDENFLKAIGQTNYV